ncbi:MAG TPA: tripartite tricarboxylate transporter substrate binding protein [Eoetvoesiella sp.]
MRKALTILGLSLVASFVSFFTTAASAAYPDRAVRVVMPYPPGGGGDLLLRTLQGSLEKQLGQSLVIDYKTGAAGNIGSFDVAHAKPDGYTLLMAPTNNFVINQYLFPSMGFDPLKSFAPISLVVEQPYLLLISSALPAKNYKQFAELAKKNGKSMNYGSPGGGTVPHISGLMLSDYLGAHMTHIPYRGSQPGLQALAANETQMFIASYGIAAGQINGDKARPIAVASQKRLASLPDVPTTAEAGIPAGIVLGNWWGFAAPAGTDPAIVNRWAKAIKSAMAEPEIQRKLVEQGSIAVASTPDQFGQILQSEAKEWKGIIDKTGVKLGN